MEGLKNSVMYESSWTVSWPSVRNCRSPPVVCRCKNSAVCEGRCTAVHTHTTHKG